MRARFYVDEKAIVLRVLFKNDDATRRPWRLGAVARFPRAKKQTTTMIIHGTHNRRGKKNQPTSLDLTHGVYVNVGRRVNAALNAHSSVEIFEFQSLGVKMANGDSGSVKLRDSSSQEYIDSPCESQTAVKIRRIKKARSSCSTHELVYTGCAENEQLAREK